MRRLGVEKGTHYAEDGGQKNFQKKSLRAFEQRENLRVPLPRV
jgi:hypothetical protein